MLRRIPFTSGPYSPDSSYKFSMATYIVGISIFFVGTVLGFYVLPTALTLFHWATWIVASLMWVGFAFYLVAYDPKRLRAFLACYFSGFGVVLLAATVFGSHIFPENGEGGSLILRLMQVLPIVGAFSSIVKTYMIGAMPDMVVARW